MRETEMNFKIEGVDTASLFAPEDQEPTPALVEHDGWLIEKDDRLPQVVRDPVTGGLFEI
jgi:hypothetical protein